MKGYAGDVFYGTYGEQTIHRVRLNEARDAAVSDEIFVSEDEPIIALEWGPRGLYYSTPTAIKVIEIAKVGDRNGRDADPAPIEAVVTGTRLAVLHPGHVFPARGVATVSAHCDPPRRRCW